MLQTMKKYAVLVAGGSGTRMGSSTPKQFHSLLGKPLLWHTVHAFLQAYTDITIILVLPEAFCNNPGLIAEILEGQSTQNIKIVNGGDSRFASVKNGLQHCTADAIIAVHDGVRCLVSPALIRRCFEQAQALGSAIPAVAATDSVRIARGEKNSAVDRNDVRLIQTPQTFSGSILIRAFEQSYQSAFTDEATVVEAMGTEVHLVEGEYRNIKITRPLDLVLAAQLLQEQPAQ